MNSNKKARAAASPAERARTTTARSASFSTSNFITDRGQKQGKIASVLPSGESNAIQARQLAAMVGAPSVRALQTMISRECAATDALILSTSRNGGGYFLPQQGSAGREEIQRYIGTLTARARHTFLRLRAARRALARLDGQTGIEEVDVDGRT